MRKVAEVIVDVPTMQTDTPFTYWIPESLTEIVMVGMRVVIPFGNGNRKIQGFVLKIENCLDDTRELKEIESVMDLHPVLNTEMLQLAEYMKETTLSFKITCLQTMLPNVMRAAYEKYIYLTDEVSLAIKEDVFEGLDEISWTQAQKNNHLPVLKKLRQAQQVGVRYEVLNKNKVKTAKGFRKLLSFEEIEEIRYSIRKNATQQHKLLHLLQTMKDVTLSFKEAKEIHDIQATTLREASSKKWLEIIDVEIKRDPYALHTFKPTFAETLNAEQQKAFNEITDAVNKEKDTVFLLQGITGSGKTEVYLQVVANVLAENKTGIILVPEISLTPQTVRRFKERFGNQVAVLHSALSDGEKYDEWRKIEEKKAQVVVGARSAIFAPLENIGIIIMDEEHEASYKQEENPRYHARDLAIWRAKFHHCPVVLGSATPSLESRARAQKKVYQHLLLRKRAGEKSQLATTKIIDMRESDTHGKMQTFSIELLNKIQEKVEKKEQVVLMLNRRGYSAFVMCRDCGFVLPCPNCDISLTMHLDSHSMKCHYCGHEEGIPQRCPECHSQKIRYYGTGTQKVEAELKELFPKAKIIRMDVDTTRRKGAHEKLLETFGEHQADILLGTQMIAKGLDFPNVTLVGVLNADTALNLPDFRSSEKTFQLLTQVSGRAGRGEKNGEVLIQTFNPEHYAIQLAKLQDYEQFFRFEMNMRHQGNYPPYFYTVQITASHEDENEVAKKMYDIARGLKKHLSTQAIVLGPTPKAIMRINNRYFYQIVIKYKVEEQLFSYLRNMLEDNQKEIQRGLKLSVDTQPLNFV